MGAPRQEFTRRSGGKECAVNRGTRGWGQGAGFPVGFGENARVWVRGEVLLEQLGSGVLVSSLCRPGGAGRASFKLSLSHPFVCFFMCVCF